MKRKIVHPLQLQLLITIGLSAVLGVLVAMAFIFVCIIIVSIGIVPPSIVDLIRNLFGINLAILIVGVVSSLVFFALFIIFFTRRWMKELEQTIRGSEYIAQGKFSYRLPFSRNEEIDQLRTNLNAVSTQLDSAIAEERNAVQAKNELVSNVSHDLRTPLTSIIGYLRLIDEDRYKDEVELRYFTDIAYRKSLRLNRMVNDLFEYTRVSFGGIRMNKRPLDIVSLLQQLGSEYDNSFRALGVELSIHGGERSAVVLADGDQLVRVFENLFANSVKYGAQGGKIDVEIELNGDAVGVKVINYGEPIPEEDLPYLFDRFYRVDKSRTDDHGGSGLGLAISRSIIDLHDGKIQADSTHEKTTFQVTLPLWERAS
ncbi:HAMP domain-containing histidine kinase [Bacillaceae bacterium SIJ1]|uniref:sensor histidine kinase n=1 Tax=Litoribacterium kuwaitense TaxID=1398745 RepID=UPI0013EC6BD3|nr:HAMP domain-containing sensor histidine kinase [Litoribacterium kuwaitense]NGP45910.1 HAMP domain-containing histidine kinase [Litoribacterium kuwaitense]